MGKFFGPILGVNAGDMFASRAALREAGVHRPPMNGIHGTAREGADSIVLSGGYIDDRDDGDEIRYTGEGGRGASGRQIADQSIESPGNAGLITSWSHGYPVRVSRGWNAHGPFAPASGYQYGGLYLVSDWWVEAGVDGFRVVRFYLRRIEEQAPIVIPGRLAIEKNADPVYREYATSRRIRDTALSRSIKELYGHSCQICSTTIRAAGHRNYAEGAHVRPLGNPHLGEDALGNLLCLCPNHHAALDLGALLISDEMEVVDNWSRHQIAELSFRKHHRLDVANAKYHRLWWTTARTESVK